MVVTKSSDKDGREAKAAKTISWQAADAISYRHDGRYYAVLIGVVVVLIGLCVWLQQWVTIGLIVLMALAIVVVNKKPSKMNSYGVSGDGVSMNGEIHSYSEYKSFGVRHDGEYWSLVLIPVKRFATETTIFIKEDQGEEIVDFVAKCLPMEKLRMDVSSRIARWLRI